MSEEQTNTQDELSTLKDTARDMDISFHPSIGLDALKKKVQDKIDGDLAGPDDETEAAEAPAKKVSPEAIKAEALKLVRIRVSNMNPAKREYEGELFCVGNRYTGMVKKYVHFNVDWHVPQIVLNMIQDSRCQVFSRKKMRTASGVMVEVPEGRLIKEYAVEVLPPLTEQERKELAQRQAMASGSSDAVTG